MTWPSARTTTLPSFATVSLSQVEASGPPTSPLGFPAPRVKRGEIVNVCCAGQEGDDPWDTSSGGTITTSLPVLRCVLNDHDEETSSANQHHSTAYAWPGLTIHTTLCGHILQTEVLVAAAPSSSSSSLAEGVATTGEPTRNGTLRADGCSEGGQTTYRRTGLRVAIKVDNRQHLRRLHHGSQAPSENPWKEVAALQLLHQPSTPHETTPGDPHPPENHHRSCLCRHSHHVIQLIDVLYDDTNLYEVFPFCHHGSLYDFMRHHPHGLPETDARHFFQQLLEAIYYCHSRGICHHDVSTQNILLTKTDDSSNDNNTNAFDLMLIDFGMAARVPYSFPDDDVTSDVTDISCGTCRRLIHSDHPCGKLRFLSPEAYEGHDVDGLAADLWAAAVVLFVLLTGRQPYHRPDARLDADFYDLLDDHYYWESPTLNDATMTGSGGGSGVPQTCSWGHPVSHPAVDLLHNMLRPDPHDRLSLSQVMEHPWVTQTSNMLS